MGSIPLHFALRQTTVNKNNERDRAAMTKSLLTLHSCWCRQCTRSRRCMDSESSSSSCEATPSHDSWHRSDTLRKPPDLSASALNEHSHIQRDNPFTTVTGWSLFFNNDFPWLFHDQKMNFHDLSALHIFLNKIRYHTAWNKMPLWHQTTNGNTRKSEGQTMNNVHFYKKKIQDIIIIFHDFPWPWLFSMTFQAWKMVSLNSMTVHDFPGRVVTLQWPIYALMKLHSTKLNCQTGRHMITTNAHHSTCTSVIRNMYPGFPVFRLHHSTS